MLLRPQPPQKNLLIAIAGAILIIGIIFTVNSVIFGAPQEAAEAEWFVVPLGQNNILEALNYEGFVKHSFAIQITLLLRGKNSGDIEPGGYRLSKSMSTWEIAGVLTKEPHMRWVVIPEGYRKEQIADILQNALGWSDEVKGKWITKDTTTNPDYIEGVYFPDTYLIPLNEEPGNIADRLRAKFNEKLSPLIKEALDQNIKWTTLVKVASIIQREAADKDDMPLIAGILWNRLLNGERLEIDATLQYIKGNAGIGWWPTIAPEDKQLDSPYNTYKNAGLPPHPISNPGLDAINAALYPEKTKCFFYLHDTEGNIHCSVTYEEHKTNIEKHLKN